MALSYEIYTALLPLVHEHFSERELRIYTISGENLIDNTVEAEGKPVREISHADTLPNAAVVQTIIPVLSLACSVTRLVLPYVLPPKPKEPKKSDAHSTGDDQPDRKQNVSAEKIDPNTVRTELQRTGLDEKKIDAILKQVMDILHKLLKIADQDDSD